jgi:sugar/nucleoside kinase (ribokinase family)
MKPIILISTQTVDHLPLADGRVRDIAGGPATYIGDALRRLGRPFTLITGEHADVQVIPGDAGQEYVIPRLQPIELPSRLSCPACIISPIIGEVPPESIPPVDGLLVIDLQGFVRTPGMPTSHWSRQFDLAPLIKRSDVIKASPSELARITPASRAALTHTLLLETLGEDGLILHDGAGRVRVPAQPVSSAHTIGAGDTLLAAFVDGMLEGLPPPDAASRAVDFTETILRERTGV